MAALTDLTDVINRATGGNSGTPETILTTRETVSTYDNLAMVTVAGRFSTLYWTFGSTQPFFASYPGGASVNTSEGAIGQTNAGGGRQKWLLGATVSSSQIGTLILYDRLLAVGGLDGTLITAQTVGGSITRNTGGVGNQIWVEIYDKIGSTARTISANYTNQFGTPGQISYAPVIGGTGLRENARIIPITLDAASRGVRAVASVTLSASTGTTGNFGVVIARPLLIMPMNVAGVPSTFDLVSQTPGPIAIDTSAALYFIWLASGTTAPRINGMFNFIES